MFENYNLDNTYLVACSGGPDSMALLDMLYKAKFKLIVCHVNYKTRDESDSEEELVREYCKKNNIKLYVTYFDNIYKGSFEVAARIFRYNFFKEIYFLNSCSGLFVAHHKDDLLETYLLKKQRNVINESYLINEKTKIYNMNVYRPLIYDYYKDDLLKYCNDNNIKYGIDKTNFMDIHPRNVIRKKLLTMDKNEVYLKALEEEKNLINTRNEVKEFIRYYPKYLVSMLKDKNDLWLGIFLYELCENKYKKYINKSILLSLKDFINSDKPNLYILIKDNYYLTKEYNSINYLHYNSSDFCYEMNELKYITTPYFKIVKEGLKMQGTYVSDDDFPIIIRNYKEDDIIALKSGSKKINRLFIDKKVPILKRKSIPIIENKNHEIIFVYGLYRKNGLKYVKNNLFMIK